MALTGLVLPDEALRDRRVLREDLSQILAKTIGELGLCKALRVRARAWVCATLSDAILHVIRVAVESQMVNSCCERKGR